MAGRLQEDALLRFTIYISCVIITDILKKKKSMLKFNNLYFSPFIIEGRLQNKSRGTITTLHLIMTITVEYEGKVDFFNYNLNNKSLLANNNSLRP